MKLTPFLSANDPPRPFSEWIAERKAFDPYWNMRARAWEEVDRLEAEGKQLEAEELRAALTTNMR